MKRIYDLWKYEYIPLWGCEEGTIYTFRWIVPTLDKKAKRWRILYYLVLICSHLTQNLLKLNCNQGSQFHEPVLLPEWLQVPAAHEWSPQNCWDLSSPKSSPRVQMLLPPGSWCSAPCSCRGWTTAPTTWRIHRPSTDRCQPHGWPGPAAPAPPQPSDHHGGPRRPWRARRVPLAAPQWLCQIPRAKQRPGPVERPRGTARSTADGVLAGPERSCTPGHRISSPRAGQDIQSPPRNKALEGIWPEFQHSCASWAGSFNKSWLILGPAKKCCVWGIRQRMTEACDVHYCRKIKQHI